MKGRDYRTFLGCSCTFGREDGWKTADIAWENTFSAAISTYIQVSLYTELQYDKEIPKAGRFKETLALDLTYKVF